MSIDVAISESCPSQEPKQASYAFLWLLPLAFVVHDGEEVLTMASWIHHNGPVLEKIAAQNRLAAYAVANLPAHWTEVAGAAFFEWWIILGVTALLFRRRTKGAGLFLFTAVLGGFTLHVLTHAGQALWFRGYTPGVVTALLLIPPASFYIYKRLCPVFSLSLSRALLYALAGGGLLLPVVLLAHRVGRALMGS